MVVVLGAMPPWCPASPPLWDQCPPIGVLCAVPQRNPKVHGEVMNDQLPDEATILGALAAASRLGEVIAAAVREHGGEADYLAELSRWSGRYGAVAGVPARSTPAVGPHSAFAARVFANPVLRQPIGTDPADDADIVLALGTASDDPLAVLRAGEATGVVLLTATALGLSSCPVTEPLEIEATRAAVRTTVLGGDGFPQALLRIGWAPLNADPLPATPRRPLGDVAQRLDGTPISLCG
jgi:nitroreductase